MWINCNGLKISGKLNAPFVPILCSNGVDAPPDFSADRGAIGMEDPPWSPVLP